MHHCYCIFKPMCFSNGNSAPVMWTIMGRGDKLEGIWCLWENEVARLQAAVTFCCLFCRMEQEVRKVAIWWAFISRRLPEWLNVSWRWSCRQLRGRARPEAQGLVPGCSSSPLKEGQQSNESHSPPNLQLVLCQLYCISLQLSVFGSDLIHFPCRSVSILRGDWKKPRCWILLILMIHYF